MPKPLPLPALEHIPDHVLEKHPEFVPNSAPDLTVPVSVSLAENAPEGAITGAVAIATDPDGDLITFSLVSPPVDGSGDALFAIDSAGQISLTAAGSAFIDYETTNSYTLTVKASDGLAAHDQTKTVAINLTDVNVAPVFTSGDTGSIPENSLIATVAYDANATDDGENSGTLTYSLSTGGDNDLFNINLSTGQVTFKESPNFEAPGDVNDNNVYDIIVHANDGTLDTTQAVAITVTDRSEATIAVAFTDQNGNHTYESGTDTLIAALLDSDDSHSASIGDTIQWGTYPITFDATGTGTFNSPDSLVTGLLAGPGGSLIVQTGDGVVAWRVTSDFEQFGASFPGDLPNVSLQDGIVGGNDYIFANPDVRGPGQPDTAVDISTPDPDPEHLPNGNQGFLDVLFLV